MKLLTKCCHDAEEDRQAFDSYYSNPCGHGSLPVCYDTRMQRGHVVGTLISGLFRSVFPILKRVAPKIAKQALETGAQIVKDVAGGQSIKDAAKTRCRSDRKKYK